MDYETDDKPEMCAMLAKNLSLLTYGTEISEKDSLDLRQDISMLDNFIVGNPRNAEAIRLRNDARISDKKIRSGLDTTVQQIRFTMLEESVDRIKDRLLKNTVDVGADVLRVETKVDELANSVANLDASMVSLKADMASLNLKVDHLASEFTSILATLHLILNEVRK